MITHLSSGAGAAGGLAAVCVLSWVAAGFFFDAGDTRILQWVADLSVFSLEANSAAPTLLSTARPATRGNGVVRQQPSHETVNGSRETNNSQAYEQQFEHPATTQWLPHSF